MIVNRIICNDLNFNQEIYSKDGKKVSQSPFDVFLDELIRDHAVYKDGGYALWACDLPDEEKKLFLSYIVDIEEYEDYLTSPSLLKAAIKDHEKYMQDYIDNRANELFHEDMKEMGLVLCQHKDNGEFYYSHR